MTAPNHQRLGHPRVARRGPREPGFGARALAAVACVALDRRLTDGAATTGRPLLEARAWQLTRMSERQRLAARLDALLDDVERPARRRIAEVSVCREEVWTARCEILRLAARLRDPQPVRAEGVALACRTLTDGAGPLYHPRANDELYRELRRAVAALD